MIENAGCGSSTTALINHFDTVSLPHSTWMKFLPLDTVRPSLIPKTGVDLHAMLVAVLHVHTPKAESVHDFTQGIVIVIKFNGSHNVEDDFRLGTHVQRMNGSRILGHIITWLALPRVPGRRSQRRASLNLQESTRKH